MANWYVDLCNFSPTSMSDGCNSSEMQCLCFPLECCMPSHLLQSAEKGVTLVVVCSSPPFAFCLSVDETPHKYTGAIFPINLTQEKERFLNYGILPQFVLKMSTRWLQSSSSMFYSKCTFYCLEESSRSVAAHIQNKNSLIVSAFCAPYVT